MKHVKPVAALCLASLLFGAGAVVGQQGEKPMTIEDFIKLKLDYDTDGGAEKADALVKAYATAPDDSTNAQIIMKYSLTDNVSNRPLLLLQTAQNQKLIEQNARIIALLEAQQKGK